MKGLSTLIKLHKRTLDELRKKMVQLENQKAQLLEASRHLQEELLHEMELARQQTEMRGFFGGFAKRIQKRQEEIAAAIKLVETQMAKLADDIAVEYGELKKYEIARENGEKRAQAEQNRKETITLDEIAGQQHRRKQKNEQ